MLKTLLENGMQMKLCVLSVPNLTKFLHWLEQGISTRLPQIQRSRSLRAISATGDVIPLMHIFLGQRFSYTPLEVGVSGAYMYFGKSEKENSG